jgi:TonB family protein
VRATKKEGSMNPKSFLAIPFAVLLAAHCAGLKAPPVDKLQVKLTDEFVELLREDTTAWTNKDATTLTLPPIPIYRAGVIPPVGRSVRIYDSVMVKAVITKRGNVKRAWIDSSGNAYFNKAALKAIVQWKFQPALRRGVPIDTLIRISVPLLEQE